MLRIAAMLLAAAMLSTVTGVDLSNIKKVVELGCFRQPTNLEDHTGIYLFGALSVATVKCVQRSKSMIDGRSDTFVYDNNQMQPSITFDLQCKLVGGKFIFDYGERFTEPMCKEGCEIDGNNTQIHASNERVVIEEGGTVDLKCNDDSFAQVIDKKSGSKLYMPGSSSAKCNKDGYYHLVYPASGHDYILQKPCQPGCVYSSINTLFDKHEPAFSQTLEYSHKDINTAECSKSRYPASMCFDNNDKLYTESEHVLLNCYTPPSTRSGLTYYNDRHVGEPIKAICQINAGKSEWFIMDSHAKCVLGCSLPAQTETEWYNLARIFSTNKTALKIGIKDGSSLNVQCNPSYVKSPKVKLTCSSGRLVLNGSKCETCKLTPDIMRDLNLNPTGNYKAVYKAPGGSFQVRIGEVVSVPCMNGSVTNNGSIKCIVDDSNLVLISTCHVDYCTISTEEKNAHNVQLTAMKSTMVLRINEVIAVDCKHGYEAINAGTGEKSNTTTFSCESWPNLHLQPTTCKMATCSLKESDLRTQLLLPGPDSGKNETDVLLPLSNVTKTVMLRCMLGTDELKPYQCKFNNHQMPTMQAAGVKECPRSCTVKAFGLMAIIGMICIVLLLISMVGNCCLYYSNYQALVHVHYAKPPMLSLIDHLKIAYGLASPKAVMLMVATPKDAKPVSKKKRKRSKKTADRHVKNDGENSITATEDQTTINTEQQTDGGNEDDTEGASES